MKKPVNMHIVLDLMNSISNHRHENDVFSSFVMWHICARSAALRVSIVVILLIRALALCL